MTFENRKTIICNLFGGPGTGKSTTAAAIFAELKYRGIEAEIVTEFAKDLTWEHRGDTFKDQLYIFAKQNHRIFRCNGKVDVIITDCPLFLSAVYEDEYIEDKESSKKLFKDFVIDTVNHYTNLNIFLKRVKPYHANGRSQDEAGAKELDVKIQKALNENNLPYKEFAADKSSVNDIVDYIVSQIK